MRLTKARAGSQAIRIPPDVVLPRKSSDDASVDIDAADEAIVSVSDEHERARRVHCDASWEAEQRRCAQTVSITSRAASECRHGSCGDSEEAEAVVQGVGLRSTKVTVDSNSRVSPPPSALWPMLTTIASVEAPSMAMSSGALKRA